MYGVVTDLVYHPHLVSTRIRQRVVRGLREALLTRNAEQKIIAHSVSEAFLSAPALNSSPSLIVTETKITTMITHNNNSASTTTKWLATHRRRSPLRYSNTDPAPITRNSSDTLLDDILSAFHGNALMSVSDEDW